MSKPVGNSTPTKDENQAPITIESTTETFSKEDMEMDESLPDDCFEACAMIHIKAGNDYPSFVPTGLVDASMVSTQVTSCAETLQFANVTSGLLETCDKLRNGLSQYSGAVSQVMEHLQSISSSAKLDFDRVCETRLIQNFGLPPSKSKINFLFLICYFFSIYSSNSKPCCSNGANLVYSEEL